MYVFEKWVNNIGADIGNIYSRIKQFKRYDINNVYNSYADDDNNSNAGGNSFIEITENDNK